MTKFRLPRRRLLQGGLATLALPGTAWAQTEEREAEGGIGGTGIVGVLTDFGSLIVGGARVETDARTRFSNAFGVLSEGDLQIGDALTLEAVTQGGQLLADRVHVTHPLAGTITEQSADGRALVVNGTRVVLERAFGSVRVGNRVVVSGIWRGAEVYATRVARIGPGPDLISGTLDRRGLAANIGPVRLRGRGLGQAESGSFVTALGQYGASEDAFSARQIDLGRFRQARAPLKQLVVEGYLEPSDSAPGFRVAGLGHSFARNLRLSPFDNKRVLFRGDYTGLFAASSAIVLPERLAERRGFLRRISQQG